MKDSAPIAARLKLLIDEAKSQKAVARMARVSDATLINWARGLGVRESTLRGAARHLAVSYAWLRDGLGDEEAELASFRLRLSPSYLGARRALREARERAGLSYADLGRRTGYPGILFEQLEQGTISADEAMVDALCRILPGLPKDDLMLGSDGPLLICYDGVQATQGTTSRIISPPGVTSRHVPLLAIAQAGAWDAEHAGGLDDYTSIFAPNVDDPRAFAIRISGNSMEPALHEGDFVICSPAEQLHNGEAAVVRTRSEQVFIKYWEQSGERVILTSANGDYTPLEFPLAEIVGAWPVVQRIAPGKMKR